MKHLRVLEKSRAGHHAQVGPGKVFIKASPEQIWQAITTPDDTARSFTEPGSRSVPTITFRAAPMAQPGATDQSWSKLTLTHDQLEGAPKTAANVSGPGWMFVLSGLKTLRETGTALTGNALLTASAS